MCKFTPCKGRVMHPPGSCPNVYGRECDGIAHYIDDPYSVALGYRSTLRWLCYGEEVGSWMDS